VLRICIPVHNEATTIGVLLWRLRTVFQGFSREYDVVVCDDASTDGTAEVLEPYRAVMPLTVIRAATHRGYAASIDALVRHVAADDDYARRDAMVLLQGDFTESPEHLPELVRRFEGGADLVAVQRTLSDRTPGDERRLRRWGRWAVKPFLRLPPLDDPFTGFRLVRISVLRDLLKALGSRPVCAGEGWAANIDFALNVSPFARRIENVELAPRYDVRQRPSRRRGWPDVVALFHWARAARQTARPVPGSKPAADAAARDRSADAALVTTPVERAPRDAPARDERGDRRPRPERGARPQPAETAEPERAPVGRADRQPREARGAREERALRGEDRAPIGRADERQRRTERPARAPEQRDDPVTGTDEPEAAERAARPPRPTRAEKPEKPVKPDVAERVGRRDRADRAEARFVTAESTPDDTAPADAALDEAEVSILSLAPDVSPEGAVSADGENVADTTARKRRRRRRSRKGRGEAMAEGQDGAENGGPDDDAGTSDDGEGPELEGASHTDGSDAGEAGVEGGGEAARRKRRNRRRRRGRRPGESDASGAVDVAPPAAEPPAA